jgi:predicted DNA-binding antitoxin AbrB/MazE fold protein
MRTEAMTITVEATYENGILKPAKPLPLREHEQVRITLETARSLVWETQGLIGWKGSPEAVERIALDPLEDL